jgi:hypothetical protein
MKTQTTNNFQLKTKYFYTTDVLVYCEEDIEYDTLHHHSPDLKDAIENIENSYRAKCKIEKFHSQGCLRFEISLEAYAPFKNDLQKMSEWLQNEVISTLKAIVNREKANKKLS